MHNPVSQLRFAPLLESYCLYCGAAVFEERRQEVETAKALHKLAMRLKDLKKESTTADAVSLIFIFESRSEKMGFNACA